MFSVTGLNVHIYIFRGAAGVTGNGREIHQTPSSPLSPRRLFPWLPPPPPPRPTPTPPPAAAAAQPQTEQAPGTRLAPKTQLRHEGKERPAWRGALALGTDAPAAEWRGRQGPATQRSPGCGLTWHLRAPGQCHFLL